MSPIDKRQLDVVTQTRFDFNSVNEMEVYQMSVTVNGVRFCAEERFQQWTNRPPHHVIKKLLAERISQMVKQMLLEQ